VAGGTVPGGLLHKLPRGTLPIASVEAGAVRLAFLVHTHARAECGRTLLEVSATHQHTRAIHLLFR